MNTTRNDQTAIAASPALRDAAIAKLMFKTDEAKRFAVRFIKLLMERNATSSELPDEFYTDKTTPGIVTAVLNNLGIIAYCGRERTHRPDGNSRKINVWTLTSRGSALGALKALGENADDLRQPELPYACGKCGKKYPTQLLVAEHAARNECGQ